MVTAPTQPLSPRQWGDTLSGPPIVDGILGFSAPVLIRRWRSISPHIEQPALDHHYVTLHLGGSKRINRAGEGASISMEVAMDAFSIVPAGAAYSWSTEGPIDFAHVYLDPKSMSHVVSAAFDREPRFVSLVDIVGARDPLIEALVHALLKEVDSPAVCERIYLEELLQLLMYRLLRQHSSIDASTPRARHALAPHRLRRTLDFIEASLSRDIGLGDVASVAGLSPYHFSRAFRQSTGASPYAFLIQRRVARALELLTQTDVPLLDIARGCGFKSHSQFSRTFKNHIGTSPNRYRFSRS